MFSLLSVEYSNRLFNDYHFPMWEEVKFLQAEEYPYYINYRPQWLGFIHENKPYKLEDVPCSHREYYKVEKITNPYLQRAFELKRCQTNGTVTITGYHGTVEKNIDSIVANNFNWRLAGRSRGVKHGRGVCFSRRVSFVAQFCRGVGKRVIKANFLCGNIEIGRLGIQLPSAGYDTTRSPNGNVLVKFEDNEFLPLYVYHLSSSVIYSHEW